VRVAARATIPKTRCGLQVSAAHVILGPYALLSAYRAMATSIVPLRPFERTGVAPTVPAAHTLADDVQDEAPELRSDSACASLAKDPAVRTARAEFLYSRGDVVAAYRECAAIMAGDARNVECMGVYLACMVELGKKNELFQLGHRCGRFALEPCDYG
jgi:hypothetical protein